MCIRDRSRRLRHTRERRGDANCRRDRLPVCWRDGLADTFVSLGPPVEQHVCAEDLLFLRDG
eukprot:3910386-Lingulodinium_polyedra.AAC.1